jgi:hypothetical protein
MTFLPQSQCDRLSAAEEREMLSFGEQLGLSNEGLSRSDYCRAIKKLMWEIENVVSPPAIAPVEKKASEEGKMAMPPPGGVGWHPWGARSVAGAGGDVYVRQQRHQWGTKTRAKAREAIAAASIAADKAEADAEKAKLADLAASLEAWLDEVDNQKTTEDLRKQLIRISEKKQKRSSSLVELCPAIYQTLRQVHPDQTIQWRGNKKPVNIRWEEPLHAWMHRQIEPMWSVLICKTHLWSNTASASTYPSFATTGSTTWRHASLAGIATFATWWNGIL